MPSTAAVGHQHSPTLAASSDARGGEGTPRSPQDFDHRQLAGSALVKGQRAVVRDRSAATEKYLGSLGNQAVVDIDPLTGTPRALGRLDGFLSGPRSGSARAIALEFVKSHLDVLGLTADDLRTLSFRKDYVDSLGVHNLSWEQKVDGTPVFGNGLQVKVTRDGRVLSVLGSPVSGLADLARRAPAAKIDASQARSNAARNVHGSVQSRQVRSARSGSTATTTWSNNDYAKRVWFLTDSGLRPGWSTYVQTGDDAAYQHVIDAVTGQALYRHSTVDKATGDAYVYDYYPGAYAGPKVNGKRTHPGDPKVVNFIKRGWLAEGSKTLDGRNVVTWADVNDDDAVNKGEQTPTPGGEHGATGKLRSFTDTQIDAFPPKGTYGGSPYSDYDFSKFCTAHYVCTWDAEKQYSWKTNKAANENNAFYLANVYHDYLQNDRGIEFTPAAGNFTASGGDPVLQQVLDGADTNADIPGMPDGAHIDNANMNTPPDGTPPVMQMYLFHTPGYPDDYDPYVPTSGALDASILLHEYTHGLSNRLVIDADGNSTLNGLQAGAMGEAWSDYYAMDYLVTKHFQKDRARDGDVLAAKYVMGGQKDTAGQPVPFRSMAIDCPVGSAAKSCYDTYNTDADIQGGYTYGDLVAIGGSPEVHSSGEVWAQTLWDIRKALGHTVADSVITRGMSLSANDPSMLDMRNAILQADLVGYDGDHSATLWKIFANRGMGYFAGATDSGDTDVAEDFNTPPNPKTHNYDQFITGTVTDEAGNPVEGATVTVAGFGDQFSAVTHADGSYAIGQPYGMYPGTYPKVVASAPGHLGSTKAVTIPAGDHATADFTLKRDWAMVNGGADVADFNGPDYSAYGCGPEQAVDGNLGTGWGSTAGDDQGDPTGTFVPKHITVELPKAVDVSSFGVDPASACGDAGSASTGDYKIEVSADGNAWVKVAEGHFSPADRGKLNTVTPTAPAPAVKYVRFTIQGNQVADVAAANGEPGTFESICGDSSSAGGYDGCQFADLTEMAVFGTATAGQ